MSVPVIHRLSQETINRIAAGEVVQRPSSAVKELIENSIDAGATSISVMAQDGGLTRIQIQDNGHGIRREDLPIVCERFTTSKLTTYEDLSSIQTFGFRGEALASMTYVSHVTILTKTTESLCGYKAKYENGRCISDILPCASNRGTLITIEDLFYNTPTRKQSFRNFAEQYQKILDVIVKYSIHYGSQNISFNCSKFKQLQPDVYTPPHSSILDNIRICYGNNLARELLPLQMFVYPRENDIQISYEDTGNNFDRISKDSHDQLKFQWKGYISNANYHHKKMNLILFINNRLVENTSIKQVVDAVYHELLPRHSYPFVYLSLCLPPSQIDVNVHPTKKEVHFLYETEIMKYLHEGLQHFLLNANQSRVFYTQTLLKEIAVDRKSPKKLTYFETGVESAYSSDNHNPEESSAQTCSQKIVLTASQSQSTTNSASLEGSKVKRKNNGRPSVAPSKLVRIDPNITKLEAFFLPISKNTTKNNSNAAQVDKSPDDASAADEVYCMAAEGPHDVSSCVCCPPKNVKIDTKDTTPCSVNNDTNTVNDESSIRSTGLTSSSDFTFVETTCKYDSVKALLKEIFDCRHSGYESMLRRHTYIGVIDATYCLVQVLWRNSFILSTAI